MRKTGVRKVIRLIKERRPKNPSEFNKIGIPLTRISEDQGIFRKVYKVRNCDLVVKFPKARSGAIHTRDEVAKIKKLKKFAVMRPHLPTVHYYDAANSVLVIDYCPKFTTYEKEADAMGAFIMRLIKSATGVTIGDIHSENVHKHVTRDNAVIIDAGY
jgi:hypothetical protein